MSCENKKKGEGCEYAFIVVYLLMRKPQYRGDYESSFSRPLLCLHLEKRKKQ
jgi:hypothetical protein